MRATLTALAVALLTSAALNAAPAEEPVPVGKLPKAVVDAVKKRFPKYEIGEASKITDGGKSSFAISATAGDKHVDVTVSPEGAILVIETDIAVGDLPKAVLAGFKEKHPKATITAVQEVMTVSGGKETVEEFEIVFTVVKKMFVAEVAPDGKVKSTQEISDKKE